MPDDGGTTADGLVIGLKERVPFRIRYQIRCDLAWRVRKMTVNQLMDNREGIEILSDGKGRWSDAAGEPIRSLSGCVDVDISATPFANTLPIRRLALRPGESSETTVAFLAVPEMELKPVKQRYTCLERDAQSALYRYEDLPSGFTAELRVDTDGLVIDYPSLFRRVLIE